MTKILNDQIKGDKLIIEGIHLSSDNSTQERTTVVQDNMHTNSNAYKFRIVYRRGEAWPVSAIVYGEEPSIVSKSEIYHNPSQSSGMHKLEIK